MRHTARTPTTAAGAMQPVGQHRSHLLAILPLFVVFAYLGELRVIPTTANAAGAGPDKSHEMADSSVAEVATAC
jgi:hypothetical protein